MSFKRLYKSRRDKMIFGVCGGIAEYFHTDPSLVRLLWILFGCMFGSGVVTYIIFSIVIPYESR